MGTSYTKIKKDECQIMNDLNKINEKTKNKLFEKRTGFRIEFKYNIKRNKISSKFYKYIEELNENGETVMSSVQFNFLFVSLIKFYDFFNTLMNCLPIFYEEEINRNIFSPTTTPDDYDENLCVICLEKKNNVMLKCYHSFCEECIQLWLLKKDKNCPMCRREINFSYDSHNNADFKNRRWSLIDKSELLTKNYMQELDDIFVSGLLRFLS